MKKNNRLSSDHNKKPSIKRTSKGASVTNRKFAKEAHKSHQKKLLKKARKNIPSISVIRDEKYSNNKGSIFYFYNLLGLDLSRASTEIDDNDGSTQTRCSTGSYCTDNWGFDGVCDCNGNCIDQWMYPPSIDFGICNDGGNQQTGGGWGADYNCSVFYYDYGGCACGGANGYDWSNCGNCTSYCMHRNEPGLCYSSTCCTWCNEALGGLGMCVDAFDISLREPDNVVSFPWCEEFGSQTFWEDFLGFHDIDIDDVLDTDAQGFYDACHLPLHCPSLGPALPTEGEDDISDADYGAYYYCPEFETEPANCSQTNTEWGSCWQGSGLRTRYTNWHSTYGPVQPGWSSVLGMMGALDEMRDIYEDCFHLNGCHPCGSPIDWAEGNGMCVPDRCCEGGRSDVYYGTGQTHFEYHCDYWHIEHTCLACTDMADDYWVAGDNISYVPEYCYGDWDSHLAPNQPNCNEWGGVYGSESCHTAGECGGGNALCCGIHNSNDATAGGCCTNGAYSPMVPCDYPRDCQTSILLRHEGWTEHPLSGNSGYGQPGQYNHTKDSGLKIKITFMGGDGDDWPCNECGMNCNGSQIEHIKLFKQHSQSNESPVLIWESDVSSKCCDNLYSSNVYYGIEFGCTNYYSSGFVDRANQKAITLGTDTAWEPDLAGTYKFTAEGYKNNNLLVTSDSWCSTNNTPPYLGNSNCFLNVFDPWTIGDVNQDSEINVVDVVNLVNHILDPGVPNNITPESVYWMPEADVNQDGVINVVDIVNLIGYHILADCAGNPTNSPDWGVMPDDCGECGGPGPEYPCWDESLACSIDECPCEPVVDCWDGSVACLDTDCPQEPEEQTVGYVSIHQYNWQNCENPTKAQTKRCYGSQSSCQPDVMENETEQMIWDDAIVLNWITDNEIDITDNNYISSPHPNIDIDTCCKWFFGMHSKRKGSDAEGACDSCSYPGSGYRGFECVSYDQYPDNDNYFLGGDMCDCNCDCGGTSETNYVGMEGAGATYSSMYVDGEWIEGIPGFWQGCNPGASNPYYPRSSDACISPCTWMCEELYEYLGHDSPCTYTGNICREGTMTSGDWDGNNNRSSGRSYGNVVPSLSSYRNLDKNNKRILRDNVSLKKIKKIFAKAFQSNKFNENEKHHIRKLTKKL